MDSRSWSEKISDPSWKPVVTETVIKTSHLIFEYINGQLVYREMIPFIADDPNQGLPDWFFEGDHFLSFELDSDGFVEWVPACGPAPCWKARYVSFGDQQEMITAWDVWFRETY